MNPPSITIRIDFERIEPVVFADYLDDGDQARMWAWLEQRPDLAALIATALELVEEARAV